MKLVITLMSILALTACTTMGKYHSKPTPEMQKVKDKCAYEIALTQLNKSQHGQKLKACIEAHNQ